MHAGAPQPAFDLQAAVAAAVPAAAVAQPAAHLKNWCSHVKGCCQAVCRLDGLKDRVG